MKKENYENAVKKLNRGDLIFVHIIEGKEKEASDFLGRAIQMFSGKFTHVENYYGNKDSQQHTTIVANGEVVAWDNLDRYLQRPEVFSLTFMRLRGITVNDVKAIEDAMFKFIGTKYDKGQIAGLAIKSALTKIPVLGFFFNMFVWRVPTPFATPGEIICSELACKLCRAPLNESGASKYPVLSDINDDSITPTMLSEQVDYFETIDEI